MHARSAKLHAGARKRASEILQACPIQAVEIGTEPINCTNRLAMYSLDQLMHLGAYNWHLPVHVPRYTYFGKKISEERP